MARHGFGPTLPRSRGRRRAPRSASSRKVTALTLAVLLTVFGIGGVGTPVVSATTPGTPGVPQAATVLLTEDFENAPTTTPRRLNTYVGASGQTYTADTPYLTNCNGNVVEFNSTNVAASNCNGDVNAFSGTRQMAYALGILAGDTTPTDNHAVSGWTLAAIPAGQTRALDISPQITLPAAGRFIIASIDVVALTCSAPPVYSLAVTSGATSTTLGSPLNVCGAGVNSTVINTPAVGTAPARTMRAATLTSNSAALVTGNTVGLTLRNQTLSAGGNDGSFDNVRILDATPQLDKAFSPPTNGTSVLTLTITNTSELAAKPGWSFTDDLPAGMTVVGTPTTNCPSGVASTSSGGARVSVTGNLNTGMASCTVSVTVRVAEPGTYTNGPSNITTSSGVNLPADATVTFAASMTIAKTASPATVTAAGEQVTYSFLVTNTGDLDITSPTVTETAFTGTGGSPTIACPATANPLSPGEQATCTATYTVTQADINQGAVDNTATVTGTSGTTPVVSQPSSARVTAIATSSLSLVKTASPTTTSQVGPVQYSFTVTNTGNTTLTDVGVTESVFTGSNTAPTIDCPPEAASLAPGASVTCTATYQLNQADLDRGGVDNTAVASGIAPGGARVDSQPSSAQVVVTFTGTLDLAKTAIPATATAAGQVITYDFLVTNNTNQTLANVRVTEDSFSGAGVVPTTTCPAEATPLDPGEQVTCTATYVVTQADIDTGTITNTATAHGDPVNGGSTVDSQPASAVVDAPQVATLTVVKSADPATLSTAGQAVVYSFVVTNTGNVSLSDVTVTDQLTAPAGPEPTVACPATTLDPGASTTCTATYTATQADVDNGLISNTATATGTPPTGGPVTSTPTTAVVSIQATPSLAVTKTANPASVTRPGQTVDYSFVVTNTGNVTLTGVALTDTLAAPAGPEVTVSCAATTLDPGASTTCTATPYTVTQADVDHGSIDNSATATGTAPDGSTTTSPAAAAAVDIPADAAMSVVKSAAPASFTTAGQLIRFDVLVTNTGNVTLAGITVADQLTAPAGPAVTVVCPVTTLDPGASTTCTATYTATQADVDHGSVVNTATATATAPGGGQVTGEPATVTVPVPSGPAVTLVKSANPSSAALVGDTITYSFLVSNTGNVTLSSVSVADTLTAPAGPPVTVACPSTTLAAGASVTCTATYTVTQADVDHGSIDNSATAAGSAPGGTQVSSPASNATVTILATPSVSLAKSANPSSVSQVGEVITYSFVVTNTGNVTLTNVSVADTLTAPAGPPLTVDCPQTSLAAGASVTCTATYTVTQADVDHGSIDNSATVTGSAPDGTQVTSSAGAAAVLIARSASLTVTKTADPATVSGAGQVINYSFVVTNPGNVSLSSVSVTDTLTAPAGPPLTVACTSTTLAPGASTTCTASYTVTQADVDHGRIDNSATASATAPDGTTTTSPPSSAVVTIPPTATLTVVKTADPTTASAVGDTVTYSFVVTSTGNVTLSSVSVVDVLAAPAGPALTVDCPSPSLSVGVSMTCTATYTIAQSDVDNGGVGNSATATGTAPDGTTVTSQSSSAVVTIARSPSVTLVKTADPTTASAAGDVVTYSFVVANTGNVTLSNVSVVDVLTAPAGPALSPLCPSTSLSVGGSMTCTATYTVTQSDVDNGRVDNTATASATGPDGTAVTSPSSAATVTIARSPAITLVKSASPATVSTVGAVITYSFVVTNTGNVTLSAVSIVDTLTAPAGPAPVITCPTAPLAPGTSITCTADYPVTQADADNGVVDNTATASGTAPDGTTTTSPPSTAVVTITSSASITLTKSADPASASGAGEVVTYSFVVTNTGNVTITGIAVADTLAAPAGPEVAVTCPSTPVAPGASTTCTSSPYTITQADVDHGSVNNTAIATATAPDGGTATSPSSSASVSVGPEPALSLVKTADPATVSTAGQEVGYSFLVTNTGNVTLTGIGVLDAPVAPAGPAPTVTCPVTTLVAGGSTTCTARYTVTQTDVDHGSVDNTATVTGTAPDDTTTSASAFAAVRIPPEPSLTLVKSADPTTIGAVGETVTFSFVVTNTGNTTLSGVAVADTLAAPAGPEVTVACPSTVLAPGESTTCTSSPYTVTQADADKGSVDNSATVSGAAPDGTTVQSAPSTTTAAVDTPESPSPGLPLIPVTGAALVAQAVGAAVALLLGLGVLLGTTLRRRTLSRQRRQGSP